MQELTFNPSNTNADKFVLFKFNFLKFFKAENKEITFHCLYRNNYYHIWLYCYSTDKVM